MNNEESTNESQAPVETPQEAPAPSLDEIANEFSVEEQANQFQAKPEPQQTVEPSFQNQPNFQNQYDPGIPDPTYDPDGYTRYMMQNSQKLDQYGNVINGLVEKISSYEQQMVQQKVDADLSKAVEHINQKLNVEPDLAETALEIEYRKNPAFQKIWNNRDKNPAAFQKALDLVADKWTGKFATRTNDQLVENVRAAKTSQQTLAKSQPDDPYEDIADMSEGEFQSWWSKQKGN